MRASIPGNQAIVQRWGLSRQLTRCPRAPNPPIPLPFRPVGPRCPRTGSAGARQNILLPTRDGFISRPGKAGMWSNAPALKAGRGSWPLAGSTNLPGADWRERGESEGRGPWIGRAPIRRERIGTSRRSRRARRVRARTARIIPPPRTGQRDQLQGARHRRGGRVVDCSGLENRQRFIASRGFDRFAGSGSARAGAAGEPEECAPGRRA